MKKNNMKLHLGCGNKFIPGWTHIDIINYKHIDYIHNIDSLEIFSDNSASCIYCCHALEHFHNKKVYRVLKEWHRVLKKSGKLLISIPDFEKVCWLYNKTKDINLINGLVMGGQRMLYDIHYSIWDFSKAKKILQEIGFKNIKKYDWRKEKDMNIIDDYSKAYYPHLNKETGELMSLNIKCIK